MHVKDTYKDTCKDTYKDTYKDTCKDTYEDTTHNVHTHVPDGLWTRGDAQQRGARLRAHVHTHARHRHRSSQRPVSLLIEETETWYRSKRNLL